MRSLAQHWSAIFLLTDFLFFVGMQPVGAID